MADELKTPCNEHKVSLEHRARVKKPICRHDFSKQLPQELARRGACLSIPTSKYNKSTWIQRS